MFTIPPEPSTQVEQALDELSASSRQFIKPMRDSTFKVRQNLLHPYISMSGPSENIRLMYDMMKDRLGSGDEITTNRFPRTQDGNRLGFYLVGECPFGEVYQGMGRSRLVFYFADMEKATELRKAICHIRDNPAQCLDDYLKKLPDKEAYFKTLHKNAEKTFAESQLAQFK